MIRNLYILLLFSLFGIGSSFAQQDYNLNSISLDYGQQINNISNLDSLFANNSAATFLLSQKLTPWLSADLGLKNNLASSDENSYSNLLLRARWTMDDGIVFRERARFAPYIGLGFNFLYFGNSNETLLFPELGVEVFMGVKYRISNSFSASIYYSQNSNIYSFADNSSNQWFNKSTVGINLAFHFNRKKEEFIASQNLIVDTVNIANYDTLFNKKTQLAKKVNTYFKEDYTVSNDTSKIVTSNSLKLQLWLREQEVWNIDSLSKQNEIDSSVINNNFLDYNYYALDKIDSLKSRSVDGIEKDFSSYYFDDNGNYQKPIVNIRKSGEYIKVDVTGGNGVELNIDQSLIASENNYTVSRNRNSKTNGSIQGDDNTSAETLNNNSNKAQPKTDVLQPTTPAVGDAALVAMIKSQSNKIDKIEENYNSLFIMMNKLLEQKDASNTLLSAVNTENSTKNVIHDTVYIFKNNDTNSLVNNQERDRINADLEAKLMKFTDSIMQLNKSVLKLNDDLKKDRDNVLNMYYSINFELNKFQLSNETLAAIDKKLSELKEDKYLIVVSGYSDSKGDTEVNLAISRKRAEFVSKILEERGVVKNRIMIRYYGEEFANPIPNAKDRRVDIAVIRN